MSRRPEYYSCGPELSEAEVTELWDWYVRTKDQEARDALIENYVPLVYQTAERMAGKLPSFIDVNDLIGAGTLGLIDAIRLFDPTREVQFSTYCSRRISGAILDELRRLDWAPRLVRSRVNQLERSREELETTLSRKPTEDELAQHMDLSEEEFSALMKETQVKTMVSLDRKWDEDDDHELAQLDVLQDTSAEDPLSELARAELKEVAIRGLSDKEKMVLVMYYYDNLSLKEIGATLKLSESRVCQIHAQILDFLRQKFNQREFSPVNDA